MNGKTTPGAARPELLLFLGIPLYFYVNLFTPAGTPFLLGGDRIYFWVWAQRIFHGERIYLDFFQFTPPGTDLLYLTFFRLFGLHLWVTNLVVFLLGLALCGICLSIAGQIMSRKMSLLAAWLFLSLIYGQLLNATHHWFSVLAVLSATRVLMPVQNRARIAAAGALLGTASFFTQTTGVAGALACILALALRPGAVHRRRDIPINSAILLLAFVAAWGVLSAHTIAAAGFKTIEYFQIYYPSHFMVYGFGSRFPGFPQALTLKTLPHLLRYLAVYVIAFSVSPITIWLCRRQKQRIEDDIAWRVTLLATVGLLLLLAVLPGLNWLRLFAVSLPELILLVWLIGRMERGRAAILALGWTVVAVLAAGHTWSKYREPHRTMLLPAGKAVVDIHHFEKYSWLLARTKPGDWFFQSAWPGAYIPLLLRNPVFLDALMTDDETRPEFVARTLADLERRQVRYILWTPRLNTPDPTLPGQDHLAPLQSYIAAHYARIHVFSDQDEIWERRPGPGF